MKKPTPKAKHRKITPGLRLEFYTICDQAHGPSVTWRLRRGHDRRGRVLLTSAERWSDLTLARQQTGELLIELFENAFEVYDFTHLSAAKTQAARRKARP